MNLINTLIRRLEQRLIGKLERYVDSGQRAQSGNGSAGWAAAALVGILSIGGMSMSAGVRADDGAYTEAQAKNGERVYAEHCAGCHGLKLEGKGNIPALSGRDFLQRCDDNGHTVDDILFIMRSFMPYNEPGKLSKQQYAEIMAYLLKANGLAAGTKVLSATAQANIALTSKP
jgi:S-disulfanyl-L-cysteine oxidoreductase SoxD